MTNYQKILSDLKAGSCNYGNSLSGISYSLGIAKMKIKADGKLQFFNSLEQMARSINRFIKTGN